VTIAEAMVCCWLCRLLWMALAAVRSSRSHLHRTPFSATVLPHWCMQADVDGSGQLSRKEFKEALKAAELGLTRKDINLILSQVSDERDPGIPTCIRYQCKSCQGFRKIYAWWLTVRQHRTMDTCGNNCATCHRAVHTSPAPALLG
jgi:hypothetical protein